MRVGPAPTTAFVHCDAIDVGPLRRRFARDDCGFGSVARLKKPDRLSDPGNIITDEVLESYGEEFGVKRYEVSVTRIGDADSGAPFQGVFSRRALSVGCDMLASDLVALRSERIQSTIAGQFIVRLPFQNGQVRIGHAAMRPIALRPNCALMVAMTADIHLDGAFVSGNRYTDFFVQVSRTATIDDELSDRIGAKMTRNVVEQFPVDPSLCLRALQICEAESDDCVQGLLAESCALELLARSLSGEPAASASMPAVNARDRKKMFLVRDRLMEEPEGDHRLVDLARAAGVSVTTLKSKFNAVFGQSVVSFLRDIRLQRARVGIASEGWTVSQAAYSVGYKHPSSFSTAFHRKFGMWPSEM